MLSDINEQFPAKQMIMLDAYLVETFKPLSDIVYQPTQFIA